MKKILLIEDDDAIIYGLSGLLEDEGMPVTAVSTLKDALAADFHNFSLALLDLGLPDGEGWRFLEEKGSPGMPPILILTARDEEKDIIKGLDMGADDYVTKPFQAGVLLSRIRAALRRQKKFQEKDGVLRCGTLLLDKRKTSAMAGGREIS